MTGRQREYILVVRIDPTLLGSERKVSFLRVLAPILLGLLMSLPVGLLKGLGLRRTQKKSGGFLHSLSHSSSLNKGPSLGVLSEPRYPALGFRL